MVQNTAKRRSLFSAMRKECAPEKTGTGTADFRFGCGDTANKMHEDVGKSSKIISLEAFPLMKALGFRPSGPTTAS